MGKWSRSVALTKMSFRVIRKDKEILLFPVMSGLVSIIVMASFFGSWFFLNGFDIEGMQNNYLLYVFLFLFYLVSYFTVIFFNVALVACSMKRLEGGDPTVRYGLGFAAGRLKVILKWALVAATVGLILKSISSRSGAMGKIVIGFIGAAWSIATYFVVPVIAFEDVGPFQAIKRSLGILRGTWGEGLLSNLGLGLIFFALALLGLVPIVLVIIYGSLMMILIAIVAVVLYWVFLGVLYSTASTVLLTALFRFATTGKVSEDFPEAVVKNPWTAEQAGWK
ncbi:MAG: DUF6159 family protein [Methanomassiliicoccales archaeon]|nr:DUF6159 family protein [Methanomassiliicoccales archaeon]